MTGVAAKTSAAADALLAWLQAQPHSVSRRSALASAPSAAGPTDTPPGAAGLRHPAGPAGGAGDAAAASPAVRASDRAAPSEDKLLSQPHRASAPDTGEKTTGDAPLRLAHTDWLHHRLTITGPDAALERFRTTSAGAGTIPWHLDLDRIEEDCFYLLAAPPPPQQRRLSLAGARIVAGQLRDAVARRHELAVARVGHSRACPFDLHALVPVPGEILRRGPDDPASLQWLWQHWGTTRELRHVTADSADGQGRQRRATTDEREIQVSFWSADWSPWRALVRIAAAFPALRFDLSPSYDPP